MVVAPRERAEQRRDLKAAGHLDRASIGAEEKVSDYKHPQDFTERKKHKVFSNKCKLLVRAATYCLQTIQSTTLEARLSRSLHLISQIKERNTLHISS